MGGRGLLLLGSASGGGPHLVTAARAGQAVITLSAVDGAVVVLFVGAILALGFSARLRSNSVLQFLAAGRALTLPAFVATLVSTWYGGILGICESVSYFGYGTWVMFGLPYYVFGVVYAFAFARRVRDGAQISLPERLHAEFGKPAALAGAVLLFLLAVPAAHVLMLGVLVQSLSGWGIGISVLVATLAGTAFLYKGGLLADARVSLLAFLAMYAGFGTIAVWCLLRYPPAETWQRIGDPALLTWDGGHGWLQVLSFFVLGAWTLVDPGFHQRVASAASPATSFKGVLVSVGFWILFDLLSIATALYAVSLNPLPESATSIDRLAVFPTFGDAVLPSGLKALFLCGMIGTILSAMVGYALVSGATLGREIFARVKNESSDDTVNRWSRVGIGIACAVAIFLGLSLESVVSLWYTWSGVVVGALLLPVAAAYRLIPSRGLTARGVAVSIGVSSAASLAWMVHGIRSGNPFLEVTWFGETFGLGTLVPGVAVSAVSLGILRTAVIMRG